jgi:NodT family efflux transporter outer membrane factor (OMF) lipoprotein
MNPALLALALSGSALALPPAEDVAREALGAADAAFSEPSAGPPPSAPWWHSMNDDGLSAVLDQAMTSNHSVLAAWERVSATKAGAWQTGSALLPTATLSTGWTRNSTEPTVQQFLNQTASSNPGVPEDVLEEQILDSLGDSYDNANWRLSGAWTVDLFGVTTTGFLASRWDAKAMEGNRAAQSMAVAANVGASWYDLVAAHQRLAYVQDQVRVGEELLQLVTLRYEAGEATALDLLQQRQQLASIQASLPAAEAAIDRTGWRLAALLGENPSRFDAAGLSLPTVLPAPPAPPPTGTPADLLRRRPDLVSAVATAEAADRRRLSAWLGLAPTLQLNAFTGDQGQLFGADAEEYDWVGNWQIGATASLPLFNGGRKLAAAKGNSANARAAFHDLEQSTLNAVLDVEDARRVLRQRNEELAARTNQADAARLSFQDSRTRYAGGLTPYVNVMTALNTQQVAELSLIQARRDLLTAHISLHNALGAPWALAQDRPAAGGPR